MSRSNRIKHGVRTQTPSGDFLPQVSYTWTVVLKAVPPEVHSGMRTADPANGADSTRPGADSTRPGETDSLFLIEGTGAVFEQIEEATREIIDAGSRLTGLAFHEGRNRITGEAGIIVRRLLSPGRYSHALAELLAPSGELTTETRNEANRFGWNAARRQLQILVYEDFGVKTPRPAAFAVIPDPENSEKLWLLARLLVTPFEISQWSDPLAEITTDQVN